MRKRIFSMLLGCVMLLGLLPVTASALPGTMLEGKTSANLFYQCSKPSTEEAGDNYYLFRFDLDDVYLDPVLAGGLLLRKAEYQRSSNEGGRGDCILTKYITDRGLRLEPVTDKKGKTYFYIKRYDGSYYKRCTKHPDKNYLEYVTDRNNATQWSIDEKDGAYIIKEKGKYKYWNYDNYMQRISVTDFKSRAVKFTIYKRENPAYVLSFSAVYGEDSGKQFVKQKDFSTLADYTSGEYVNGVADPIKITLPCEAMKGFKLTNISFFHNGVTLGADPGVITRDTSKYFSQDPDIVTIVANSKEGVSGRIEQKKIKVEVRYEGHETESGIPIDGTQEIPDSDYEVIDPGSCVKHGTKVLKCKNCGLPVLQASNGYGDHNWDSPTYTWNDDHSACTATRECKNSSSHTETAIATVSRAITQPTCTSDGECQYTAIFDKSWASTQNYTEKNADKTGHTYGDWTADGETGHYRVCTLENCPDADKGRQTSPHDFDDEADTTCDTCGYTRSTPPVPHKHTLTPVPEKAATCTTTGNTAYYTCDGCGKWFADAEGTSEITDRNSVIINANGHTLSDWKTDDTWHWKECTASGCTEKTQIEAHSFKWIIDKEATESEKGSKHEECTICGYMNAAVDIPAKGSETKPAGPTDPVKPGDATDPTGTEGNKSGSTTSSSHSNPSQTGDSSNMFLWLAMLLVSGGAVIGTTVYSRKKRENAE